MRLLFLLVLFPLLSGCMFVKPAAEQASIYARRAAEQYCELSAPVREEIRNNYFSTSKGAWIWVYCENLI